MLGLFDFAIISEIINFNLFLAYLIAPVAKNFFENGIEKGHVLCSVMMTNFKPVAESNQKLYGQARTEECYG